MEQTKEERLEKLKSINPDAYRILSAIIQARGKQKEGIPNAFSYIRALQEFDKKQGIMVNKGQYTQLMKEYDRVTESYRQN